MFCGIVAAAEEPVSAGPAPNSGDGDPGIDQSLKPEIPGIGPAPYSGPSAGREGRIRTYLPPFAVASCPGAYHANQR